MIKILRFGFNGIKNNFLYKLDMRFGNSFSKPTICNILPTYRCNFRCKQCGVWKIAHNYKEINTDQWKKIISDLHRWLGTFYLNINGGEPLVRKDVPELIRFSNNLGIITDIITNGSLIDKKMAEKLVDFGLNKITFSLDGANPKTHDNLRNFEGAFDRVIRAIKFFQILSPNLNISINSTIMEDNLDELKDLINLALKYNVNGIYFRGLMCNDIRDDYSINESYKESKLWPKDYGKFCKSIEEIIKLKLLGYPVSNSVKQLNYLKKYYQNPCLDYKELKCLYPMRSLTINCEGRIKICTDYLGSLLDNKSQDIWYSDKALAIREQKRTCKRSCILKNRGDLGDSLKDNFRMFYGSLKNNFKIVQRK